MLLIRLKILFKLCQNFRPCIATASSKRAKRQIWGNKKYNILSRACDIVATAVSKWIKMVIFYFGNKEIGEERRNENNVKI